MTEATGLMAHNWGFAIFLLGVVGLCAFMLGVSSLLGSKAWGRSKNEPFESGMLPTGGARLRLSAKFYLVAMMFIIFDIEVVFMYPWALVFKEMLAQGPAILISMLSFIGILVVGYIYALKKGAFDWKR